MNTLWTARWVRFVAIPLVGLSALSLAAAACGGSSGPSQEEYDQVKSQLDDTSAEADLYQQQAGDLQNQVGDLEGEIGDLEGQVDALGTQVAEAGSSSGGDTDGDADSDIIVVLAFTDIEGQSFSHDVSVTRLGLAGDGGGTVTQVGRDRESDEAPTLIEFPEIHVTADSVWAVTNE